MELRNSFWDHLSAVSSRDYDDLLNNHRIDQLEEALVFEQIIPRHSRSRYGGDIRRFCAGLLRFVDESEVCDMPSRNPNAWIAQGYSSSYLSWIDALSEKQMISYDRESRTLEPTELIKRLAQPTLTVLEL